mmetsp:Transcript_5367/g.15879  ORF Transcript_5367/g.15879 Transcript_5367/m.15879 type:complete len:249 (-) Transcript_5367:14-760(-)
MGKRHKKAKKDAAAAAAPAKPKKKPSLKDKLAKKLAGGRFRQLNEDLYTSTGAANFARFREDPELAEAYHRGFREQASGWPENPLDAIIAAVKALPGRRVVADMGCGDARLAREAANHDVRSFDLVETAPGVVACDIARTPLASATVDVAVFCLALMGPSLWDFIREARRVLKDGGLLKVAEVKSRFEGGAGVRGFVEGCAAAGFDLVRTDDANRMFVALDFVARRPPDDARLRKVAFSFRPCVYKKR